MALPDLTGLNIQDTYQRVLQIDNGSLRNGTGSLATLTNITSSGNISASGIIYASQIYASAFRSINGSLISHSPSGATNIIGNDSDALKFDGTSTTLSAGPILTAETFTSTNYISATNITASGNISASGTITAVSFVGTMDGGSF